MELGAAMELGAEIEVREGGPEEPPVTLVNARAALCLEALPDPSSDDVSEGEEPPPLPPPPPRRRPPPGPAPCRPRPRCPRCGRSFAHPARLARHRARHAEPAGNMAAPGVTIATPAANMAAPGVTMATPANMAAPGAAPAGVLGAILGAPPGSVVVAMETLADVTAGGGAELAALGASGGGAVAMATPEVAAFPALWPPGEAEVVSEGVELGCEAPEVAGTEGAEGGVSGGDVFLFRVLPAAEGGALVLEVAPAPPSPPVSKR